MADIQTLNRAANNIRILTAAMVEKAKSGHPGGAMGGADFINILYSQFLTFDPTDPNWINRDRFFLDPGHMSPMLYSVLLLCDKFTMDDIKSFRQWGSKTPGHPEVSLEHGIENTSGPLGQGHTMVSRRRSPKVRDVSRDTLACITSSCSTMRITSSSPPRSTRYLPRTSR